MNDPILKFDVKGQPVQCSRYGCGHINETYLVTCDSGLAFGRFQRVLAEFPAQSLHESIADFHNTRARFAQLHAAMEKNHGNRVESCRKELEFPLAIWPPAMQTQPRAVKSFTG